MNGRGYDYNLGRFLSVDPVIQSPGNSQSLNPYSYIMNNPLAGTDPSGYTGCAASKIDSVCDSTLSHYGGNGLGDIKFRLTFTAKSFSGGNGSLLSQAGSGTQSTGASAGTSSGSAADLLSQSSMQESSTSKRNAFDTADLSSAMHPIDPKYQEKLDGMNSLFENSKVGPGSEFETEGEIISLLDKVVHPYATKIKMEIGTTIYTTKSGKLTFAPLILADNGNPMQVELDRSVIGLRIAPARVTADWHSHAGFWSEMSGEDRDLAISLNRTSYVSSK